MTIKMPFKALPETRLAVNSAIKAGKAVLNIYNRDFSSFMKEDEEPLTEADLKSQKIILSELSSMKHSVISEESKDRSGVGRNEVWIVDPLDGTSDFINKTGEFSVMISFVKNHMPIIGVVYQPVNSILYVAQKDCGAYQMLSDKWFKLSVNNKFRLKGCRAIVSRHHLAEHEKEFLRRLNISSFIQKGSCGLKVAYICKGKAELYFTTTDKIKQWDTCAAFCLITEANGKMTDMFGNELRYNTEIMNHQKGILVTNGKIHAKIIKRYKNFLEK